jgi:hypothetical protein
MIKRNKLSARANKRNTDEASDMQVVVYTGTQPASYLHLQL